MAIAALLAAGLMAVPAAVAAPAMLGVRTLGAPQQPTVMDATQARIGHRPALWMWFVEWEGLASVPYRDLEAVHQRGARPLITWEPWDVARPRGRTITLRGIAAGRHDREVRAAARHLAGWRRPVLLRFASEMNLRGATPWGAGAPGAGPANFRNAWIRVVRLFRLEGATNVRWVWSANILEGSADFADYHPGDRWVDWVALDGYNWGRGPGTTWRTPWQVFGPSYRRLAALSRRPIMLGETATPERGGDKAAWIHQLGAELDGRMRRVRAVVWFDRAKERDWRIASSPRSLRAFRTFAAGLAPGKEYGAR